jgi:hypothetical protein
MTSKNPKTPTKGKAQNLEVTTEPGKTSDRQTAELAAHGVASNALTLVSLSRPSLGELSLTDCVTVLREKAGAINRGDMREAEALLSAQVASLNALYTELARRAVLNMGEHLGATETYLRLAMKAQSQCRSTIETLAEMKNPPVVFARQANISHGAQQVNNGVSHAPEAASSPQTRTGEKQNTPTELLQDLSDGRTQLDTRATPTAGTSDQALEPVAAVHRSAH